MTRLSHRLIAIFAAATVVPLGVTVWITTSLLDRSLRLASTRELDTLSRSLEQAGRNVYQQAKEQLSREAREGGAPAREFKTADQSGWPLNVSAFYESGEREHFELIGAQGETLALMVRRDSGVLIHEKNLGIPLRLFSDQHRAARELVDRSGSRDLRRGFAYTFGILAAAVWLIALAALVCSAHRVSKPIHELTLGLERLADGDLNVRIPVAGHDEISNAARAFNHSAEQLRHNGDRLVHLTRLSSWQTLARKMAHEVKNSLTPIRLTMEELLARSEERDHRFLEQAAQIVTDEVGTLERRVRAFTEFAAEPPVALTTVDLNSLVEERVAFLRNAHPGSIYNTQLEPGALAVADEDLLKSILTNLLENAAEAAGPGGVVLARTRRADAAKIAVEVHDSGPGLSMHARESLFEPTISFKRSGMGLGLSIARRSALLSGGDIQLVDSELGGASFRVMLPATAGARSIAT